jgi:hypothetical protein
MTITQKLQRVKRRSLAVPGLLLLLGISILLSTDKTSCTFIEQIDITLVWSVHRAGPPELLTRDGIQYVAYFDHDRFLTMARRKLDSNQWKYHRFPVQMG